MEAITRDRLGAMRVPARLRSAGRIAGLVAAAGFAFAAADAARGQESVPPEYVYVTAEGPNLDLDPGQQPPPVRLYQYRMQPGGGLDLIGTLDLTGKGTLAAISNHGFAYFETSSGFAVYRIGSDGLLVDTQATTGSLGALALFDATSRPRAYVMTIDGNDVQSVVSYDVDTATGLFTQVAVLAGVNNVGSFEFFRTLDVQYAGKAVYAASLQSIGQFVVQSDGSVTQGPTLAVPGADYLHGCNLLAKFTGRRSATTAFATQSMGGSDVNCSKPLRSNLLRFAIDPVTALLTISASRALPSSFETVSSTGLDQRGGFAYVTDFHHTPTTTICRAINMDWPRFSGTGSVTLDAFDSTSSGFTQVELERWTDPTIVTSPVAAACDLAADGLGSGGGAPIAVDLAEEFLLAGDPGTVVRSVERNHSIPYRKSVQDPATLKVYAINGSTGALQQVASVTMGANQVARDIQFFLAQGACSDSIHVQFPDQRAVCLIDGALSLLAAAVRPADVDATTAGGLTRKLRKAATHVAKAGGGGASAGKAKKKADKALAKLLKTLPKLSSRKISDALRAQLTSAVTSAKAAVAAIQ